MEYIDRFYRRQLKGSGLKQFRVSVGESDLYIAASVSDDDFIRIREGITEKLLIIRRQLKSYIERQPEFAVSMVPVTLLPGSPDIVVRMAEAAESAGVGPMAAVAGAIAEEIGTYVSKDISDVIVENGGDIFINSSVDRNIGIYSGSGSGLSDKLAIKVDRDNCPLGICTSAGTIGPSVSLGRADAVVVLSKNTAIADAAATAIGNKVKKPSDIKKALTWGSHIKEVKGIVVIIGEKLGAWGDIEFV